MSKDKTKNIKKKLRVDTKKAKKYFISTSRVFALIILLAGVIVFELPELTWREAIGSVSLLTMVVALFQWVR